jgi:hypothetical protein
LKRELNASPKRGSLSEWSIHELKDCSRKQGRGGRPVAGTFVLAAIYFARELFEAYSMSTDLSKSKARFRRRAGNPVVYALAVAVFGLLSMLIVDHGPWNRPHAQTAEAHYATTSAAARAAGATVTPTMPKPALEPVAPVPKPVQPTNPATP